MVCLSTHRQIKPGTVAASFNPSSLETEAVSFYESGDNLVYIASSRTARAAQRDLVSKKKGRKEKVCVCVRLEVLAVLAEDLVQITHNYLYLQF